MYIERPPTYPVFDQNDPKSPNWTSKPKWIDIFKGHDDERLLFKTLLMTKYTGSSGAFLSFCDILLATQAETITVALQRILFWNVPLIGGGIAYTAGVCMASSFRGKKDDYVNHFYGGFAAGSVLGAMRKNFVFGAMVGLGLGFYGAIHKDCVIQGITLWPDLEKQHSRRGWSLSHKEDYSMEKERPGYWVREAPTGKSNSKSEC